MNVRLNRRRPVRTVIAAGLLAVSAMIAIGVTPQAARAQSPLNYVALGDSYSAGPLDGPTTGNLLCLQSSASYPYDTASHLGASLNDVSCSAATSADLVNTSQYPGVPPQVDALSSSTQLVTLTDGGNDNGLFVSAILDCGITDILDIFNIGSPCKDLYGNTFVNDVASDASTVKQTFATIKADAPNAQIFVLGYPDILPSSGGCYPTMPLTNGDTSYLNTLEVTLNSMIQTEAAAAGVHFVSTYAQFEGHGSCASGSNQWINAIIATNGGISVHPNAVGEQQMADILESALAADGIS
ncbi:MAG: SGNH/GDSL hydrolase family protein [Acidimicrobiales bacterium]|jgi:lysophospholipase L1-like esterase